MHTIVNYLFELPRFDDATIYVIQRYKPQEYFHAVADRFGCYYTQFYIFP